MSFSIFVFTLGTFSSAAVSLLYERTRNRNKTIPLRPNIEIAERLSIHLRLRVRNRFYRRLFVDGGYFVERLDHSVVFPSGFQPPHRFFRQPVHAYAR